ncbi:MAG: glutamate-cysteine ligase family protein [Candidatus Aenigmatarchaeota archaeon]
MYEESINIVNNAVENVSIENTLSLESMSIDKEKPKNVKKIRLGLEAEMFVLNEEGDVVNTADVLLKSVKKNYLDITIKKEAGKNMLELTSFPHVTIQDTVLNIIRSFEGLLLSAETEGYKIFTLGTYPGVFAPEMRPDKPYKIKEQIFGKTRFAIAGRCIGFHCHYTLPWGVFDPNTKHIKNLKDSKNKENMVNSYNLLIAMDPGLTTFMQSSPFYQGRYMGKDSRMIVYRGGPVFNYPQGLYAQFQNFGALQPYKHTSTDLIHLISKKHNMWKDVLKKADIKFRVFAKHGSILDTTWNPVKINANGTIEQRGMDMNHPLMITAASMLIKYILKEVQEEFINVVASDIGIKDPFKMEDNTLYIPPHTYVRQTLQKHAAFDGLENNEVYEYCKRLLKLGTTLAPKSHKKLLDPFAKMIDDRKTVSDQIMAEAKKLGADPKGPLTKDISREIALIHSKRLFKEIVIARKSLEEIQEED